MRCPQCGADVPEDAKFCSNCGAKQESRTTYCMYCGTALSNGEKVCEHCRSARAVPQTQMGSMNYCRFCGTSVSDSSNMYCRNCGKRLTQYAEGGQDFRRVNDSGSIGWAILSFVFPFIGFILWLAWIHAKPKCSRMAGIGLLINIILNAVVILSMVV